MFCGTLVPKSSPLDNWSFIGVIRYSFQSFGSVYVPLVPVAGIVRVRRAVPRLSGETTTLVESTGASVAI